jgi:hypothetical protein
MKGMTPVVAIADCKVSNGNSTVSIDKDTPTRNGGK